MLAEILLPAAVQTPGPQWLWPRSPGRQSTPCCHCPSLSPSCSRQSAEGLICWDSLELWKFDSNNLFVLSLKRLSLYHTHLLQIPQTFLTLLIQPFFLRLWNIAYLVTEFFFGNCKDYFTILYYNRFIDRRLLLKCK